MRVSGDPCGIYGGRIYGGRIYGGMRGLRDRHPVFGEQLVEPGFGLASAEPVDDIANVVKIVFARQPAGSDDGIEDGCSFCTDV